MPLPLIVPRYYWFNLFLSMLHLTALSSFRLDSMSWKRMVAELSGSRGGSTVIAARRTAIAKGKKEPFPGIPFMNKSYKTREERQLHHESVKRDKNAQHVTKKGHQPLCHHSTLASSDVVVLLALTTRTHLVEKRVFCHPSSSRPKR
eukprot:2757044-Amphidinium_carterae.2